MNEKQTSATKPAENNRRNMSGEWTVIAALNGLVSAGEGVAALLGRHLGENAPVIAETTGAVCITGLVLAIAERRRAHRSTNSLDNTVA